MQLKYLLDKITSAPFIESPFKHIEIKDFFSAEHFKEIIESSDINIDPASNDNDLFSILFEKNYKIIKHAGCIEEKDAYIKWHKKKKIDHRKKTSNSGFGLALRLEKTKSNIINDLMTFLDSSNFIQCVTEKFNLDHNACKYDNGIHKYLDGYEISPHPDIRRKALTFMVNINPNDKSEDFEIHTSYMKFLKEWKYVQEFWSGRPDYDRCWVPWDWCKTVKQQRSNNSIVIFQPADDTIHAIKADYNHLDFQRTQLYGNFFYHDSDINNRPEWEDYIIERRDRIRDMTFTQKILNKSFSFLSKNKYSSETHMKRIDQ